MIEARTIKSSGKQNGRTPVFREREVRRSCGRVPEGCLLGRGRRSRGLSHKLGGELLRRTILFLISRLMRMVSARRRFPVAVFGKLFCCRLPLLFGRGSCADVWSAVRMRPEKHAAQKFRKRKDRNSMMRFPPETISPGGSFLSKKNYWGNKLERR